MVNQRLLEVALLFSIFAQLASAGTTSIPKQRKGSPGKHLFPATTEAGKQLANEFQLLHPENIRNKIGMTASSYTITEISPLLINNDDVVTVTYTSDTPSNGDWIGAYSPADADINTVVPVKYGWCDDHEDYDSSGTGSMLFNMTNLRADTKFYYFSNGLSYPNMVGTYEPVVQFNDYNTPLKARVVPTGDYDQYQLLWSSKSSSQPTLKYSTTKGGPYTTVTSATTETITIDQMCGSPANTTGWFDLGLVHTAYFNGLASLPNQKVYYVFGDEATNSYSEEHTLYVPPLPGTQPPSRGTQVVLFCDLGRGSADDTYTWYEYGRPSYVTMQAVGHMIQEGQVDAVFHGGDISYATGFLSVWDYFLDMLSPVAASVPYLTTVGNHESDWWTGPSLFKNDDSGGECGVVATTLVPMPEPATTNKPWWSYDIGLIHFVGMSTEHDFSIGSDQYNWLKNDLESVDRTVTPWVLFNAHRAMYINSDYGGTVSSDITVMNELIRNLEPLLWDNRVNLGFYGHNHAVQRHSAVLNKTVVQASVPILDAEGNTVNYHDHPQATVHMVIGTGGATFTKNAVTPGPDWNEMYFYEYGYAVATAENASYLNWKWIDSSTGEVLDRMVITQGDPTQPWVLPGEGNDDKSNDDDDEGAAFQLSSGAAAAIGVSATVCVLVGVALVYWLFTGVSVCAGFSNWLGGADSTGVPNEKQTAAASPPVAGSGGKKTRQMSQAEIAAAGLSVNPMAQDEHAM